MNKFVVSIEYDGTLFYGSQKQNDFRTVQGVFERALKKIHNRYIKTEFASRTDSGVHAAKQVVSFFSERSSSNEEWTSALNFYLPEDIAVNKCSEVDDDFDVRRDAKEREYVYKIYSDNTTSPLIDRYSEHYTGDINVQKLNKAAKLFEGKHDFLSFVGRSAPKDRSSIREIRKVSCEKIGNNTSIRFYGQSFLYQQVRRMVGALILILKNKLSNQQLAEALSNPVRGTINNLPSSKGLCLSSIKYERLSL
jgi:tRNA pseudouridine38-40 synthase